MIQDGTQDFYNQQAELARQYRLLPQTTMTATENIAASAQPESAESQNHQQTGAPAHGVQAKNCATEKIAAGAGGVSGPLMGIAAPPTAQAEGWVSVDERLPAKNTEVLICFAESPLPSTGQYTGHAADPAGWCYPNESYLWPGESEKLPDGGAPTVTHWMPLPLPPTSAEGVGS